MLPRLRPLLPAACLLAADLAAVAAAVAIAVAIRRWFNPELDLGLYLNLWPALGLFAALYASARLYADLPPPPSDELKRLSLATTLGFVMLAAFTFMLRGGEQFSRVAFVAAWILALGLVPLMRVALRSRCVHRSWWGHPVLIIGAGRTAEILIDRLRREPWYGLRPVAAVDDDAAKVGQAVAGVAVVARVEDAPRVAAEHGCRHAIVAMPGASQERLIQLWRDLGPEFPHLVVIPGLVGFASLWVEAKDLGGVLGLEVRQRLLMPGPRALKRLLDLALCLAAAIPVGALVALFAVVIKLDSRGPLFYGQRRLGRGGREFTAWKFRSMRSDADAALGAYLEAHPELKAEWERDRKLKDDPRITRFGRFLRKTSLDELPQIWNILSGEMSWVGPRPIVQAEVERYRDSFALYRRVRPGLTGLWQVSGRNLTTYEERVAFDAYYVRNWSPWLDIFILAKTVRVVLYGEGAY